MLKSVKRKIIFIMVFLLFLMLSSRVEAVTLTFNDANLYDEISYLLCDKATGFDDSNKTITIDDVSNITSLKLNNLEITDISGIENFTSLVELNLSNNNISDISKLSSLTNLKKLEIYGCAITDISALNSLTKLETLNVSKNKLVDEDGKTSTLSQIKGLTALKQLDVSHNYIEQTGALANFHELTILNLYDNHIINFGGLTKDLTKLESLKIGQNAESGETIKYINALNNLTNLKYLDFSDNHQSTIMENITNLTKLETLSLQGNSIEDISGLTVFVNLKDINLYNNKIVDISPIIECGKIERLILGKNKIQDISPLYKSNTLLLADLKEIDISNNSISTEAEANIVAIKYFCDQSNGGNLVVNYEYLTDTTSLPHYDENGIAYVTYDDFGARCDGVYDDFIAMRNAHIYANQHGYEVRATEGKQYHIYKYYENVAYINTNTDWNNAKIIVHDEKIEEYSGRYNNIFSISNVDSDEIITITNPEWTINTNTKKMSALYSVLEELNSKGYKRYLCTAINDNKKQYIRYGAVNGNSGTSQKDNFIIDSDCNILNDIQWDFEEITSFTIQPIPNESINIKNAKFIYNNIETQSETPYKRGSSDKKIYYYRGISINKSGNINISNVSSKLNVDELSGSYSGFISVNNCADLRISDCELFTRKMSLAGRSTYGLIINNSVNVECTNITSNGIYDDNRWGITNTNFSKDVVFSGCYLNRVDAHQGIYNLTVKDSTIGTKGLTMTGQGALNIINTKVTAEKFINLREDYGSTWNGDVNIIDCTYVYKGSGAPKLFYFNFQYDGDSLHDFGYDCKFPDVYISNLTIDNQNNKTYDSIYIIPNFDDVIGENYPGNSSYWPENIYINGYKIINDTTNSYIRISSKKIDKDASKTYNYVITKFDLKLNDSNGESIIEEADASNSIKMSTSENVYLKLTENNSAKNNISIYKNGSQILSNQLVESSYTNTFSENGTYKVVLTSEDNNFGNFYTGEETYQFTIDDGKPTISSLTASTTDWTNGNVTLTVTASDDVSGLETKAYSWDGKNTWTTSKTYEVSTNGTYIVYVKDKTGNVSSKSITISNIDKDAPTITSLTPNISDLTNGNVTLTVSATDGASGLATQPYSWYGKNTWTTSKTYEVSTNGTYTVYVKDQAGNIGSKSIKISHIDKDSPEISSLTASITDWTNGNVTLTATATDKLAGLAVQAYSWDEKNTWTASKTYEVSKNGTYTVYVRDALGNVSSKEITISNIDKDVPTISSLVASTTDWTNGNVTLTVSATDEASGLATQAYSWDGKNTWTASKTYEVSKNGTYIVYVKDKTGNVSNKEITISNIDKDAPEISSLVANTADWTNGNVTLTVTATDGASGLVTQAYSWDGKSTWTASKTYEVSKNGTYVVYVRDSLGNISSKSITISNIDKDAPTISSLVASTTDWTNENVTLTVTATDGASGLAIQAYSWDGKSTWTTSKTYEVSKNGTYTVYVKDKAGNISSKSITISNIDKDAPIIGKLTEKLINGKMTLTIIATDELSGLVEQAYSWDGKNTWTSNNEYEITENGTYTVYIRDKVGNILSTPITVSSIYKLGDINTDNEIDVTDLLLLKRHIVSESKEEWKLTGNKVAFADINGDNEIDVTDLLLLKRHIVSGDKEEWKIK